MSPVVDLRHIEIAGSTERFFAQQLANKGWLVCNVKTVERSSEDDLAPPIHRRRHPAFSQQTQEVLISKTMKLPAWIEGGQKTENVLIQARVPYLHRRMHGYPVSFSLQQVSG